MIDIAMAVSELSHFVQDAVAAKHLKLVKVKSKLNGADILTKPTREKDLYVELRRCLMGH